MPYNLATYLAIKLLGLLVVNNDNNFVIIIDNFRVTIYLTFFFLYIGSVGATIIYYVLGRRGNIMPWRKRESERAACVCVCRPAGRMVSLFDFLCYIIFRHFI